MHPCHSPLVFSKRGDDSHGSAGFTIPPKLEPRLLSTGASLQPETGVTATQKIQHRRSHRRIVFVIPRFQRETKSPGSPAPTLPVQTAPLKSAASPPEPSPSLASPLPTGPLDR